MATGVIVAAAGAALTTLKRVDGPERQKPFRPRIT
jgi:hypothetical protein